MATPSQSHPDDRPPMFTPFTLPVTYHRTYPPIAYGPPLFPCYERHRRILAVPLPRPFPTTLSDETSQAGPSTTSPTHCRGTILSRTLLQPSPASVDDVIRNCTVHFTDIGLWKLFDDAENEMIVTKPGR